MILLQHLQQQKIKKGSYTATTRHQIFSRFEIPIVLFFLFFLNVVHCYISLRQFMKSLE